MSDLRKSEVPAEIPASPRDRRDDDPAESKRAWKPSSTAIEEANAAAREDYELAGEEAA